MINTKDARINYYLTLFSAAIGLMLWLGGGLGSHLAQAGNNATNASCTETSYDTGACGSVSFPETSHSSTASLTCPVECTGTLTRTCSNGSWGAVSGSCALPPACTEIHTCTDLQNMKNNLSGCYVLANDIDCAETKTWNNGAGFEPIGKPTPFIGKLHGNNKKIMGLYIKRNEKAGLFNIIAGAEIRDLNLTSFDVTGENAIAGVAAIARTNSIIENVHVQGQIRNTVPVFSEFSRCPMGGIVGENRAIIKHCSSNVEIASDSSGCPMWAGGLVGINWSQILESFSTGSITAINDPRSRASSAGLVSCNAGRIENSYSSAYSKGTGITSGLVGLQNYNCGISEPINTASITNSFASGITAPALY